MSLVMKKAIQCMSLLLFFIAAGVASAQQIQNPILFVTQVPTPNDSANVASLFGNHSASMVDAPRGGDLWIRYPDGTLKNLTKTAGYGVDGMQSTNAIAVRQPSVHWSGKKALFSMVVGGATKQGDQTPFYWQIYEITGLGETETPVIRKVENQPANFNNVSPIYGTDDRIIFTSDRTITGERHLYPAFDEYKGTITNTGMWSLDRTTGDLIMLDNSPSGDFSPYIDSYGRLLVMRWDRLQRDRNADIDAMGPGQKGTFNYTDESASGIAQYNVRPEYFPEPQGKRTDLLNGTNMVGFEFNRFFPWQFNEDGSTQETLNHLGRHEVLQVFGRSITDDSNVVNYDYSTSGRSNRNPIVNFTQVVEDPKNTGTYFGIDALQFATHSGGQIVSITAAPTLDPDQSVFTYITNRATNTITGEGATPNANHSGFYRNPQPLSDGTLIASHSSDTHADKNLGSRANPLSRYDYRITTLKRSGNYWVADQPLTTGISKTVSYWDPDVMVQYSGALWELDAVEVRAREVPARRAYTVGAPEQRVFSEEGVDVARFKTYLKDKSLAVAITRDITHRDAAEKQQPFYLRVAGTTKQSANAKGKIYDVSHFQFYQGDYIRGNGMLTPSTTPHEGRRILAVPMHIDASANPDNANGPEGSVKVADDGSVAAFVPTRRAITWEMLSPKGEHIVRERYWVTYQPGDVRTCASCHGTNDQAVAPKNPIPQNKPEALRILLQHWKSQVMPSHVVLQAPATGTNENAVAPLQWSPESRSTSYHLQIASDPQFTSIVQDQNDLMQSSYQPTALPPGTYYWRVAGSNNYIDGDWSDVWNFSVHPIIDHVALSAANSAIPISTFPEPFTDHTTIEFEMKASGNVRVLLYDLSGRELATVKQGMMSKGHQVIPLDLSSNGLSSLTSGTYVLSIQTDEGRTEHPVHLLR